MNRMRQEGRDGERDPAAERTFRDLPPEPNPDGVSLGPVVMLNTGVDHAAQRLLG